MSEQDRRYARRVDTTGAVATVWSDSREIRCPVVNVSIGGMALQTPAGVSLARFIRLRADLGKDWPKVDLDAIVLRQERRRDCVRWGVEFYREPPHIVAQIEAFVRAHSEDSERCGSSDGDSRPDVAPEPRLLSKAAGSVFTADSHLNKLYAAAVRRVGT